MRKDKATFVTIIITVMLLAILAMLFILNVRVVFFIICAIFSLLGLFLADAWMLGWLCDAGGEKTERLDPVDIVADPAPFDEDEIYNEIRRELGGDDLE